MRIECLVLPALFISSLASAVRQRKSLSPQTPSNGAIFPLLGAVFLPHDKMETMSDDVPERHLATIESVMPIIDVAIADAYRHYIRYWYPASPHWLQIHEAPVLQCDDQKRAAWAALEAIQWTNGSGVTRILSFYGAPMFTNAGFSEFFQDKSTSLLTRVGPQQAHVSSLLERLFTSLSWSKAQLLYEKAFWESELREAGFCKLLMNGLYLRTAEQKWELKMDARIVPSTHVDDRHSDSALRKRDTLKTHLIDAVGNNYGGGRHLIS